MSAPVRRGRYKITGFVDVDRIRADKVRVRIVDSDGPAWIIPKEHAAALGWEHVELEYTVGALYRAADGRVWERYEPNAYGQVWGVPGAGRPHCAPDDVLVREPLELIHNPADDEAVEQ